MFQTLNLEWVSVKAFEGRERAVLALHIHLKISEAIVC